MYAVHCHTGYHIYTDWWVVFATFVIFRTIEIDAMEKIPLFPIKHAKL